MSRSAVPAAPPDPGALADLERRMRRVEEAVGVASPLRPPSPPGEAAAARAVPVPTIGPPERTAGRRAPTAGAPAPEVPRHPRPVAAPALRPPLSEAVLGGRVLAWAGGAALLFALGTLFWIGVRDGWLGEELRCVLGVVASLGLLGAGLRNARAGTANEASWAMAGTGLAGLYATGAVATATYGLLPGAVGLAALAALGAAAVALALRWEAQPLAGVGLLGALAAPVIAPVDGLVLPVVVVALAATGLLLRLRPWTWLAAAATALALPQVVWHVGVLLFDLDGATDAGAWAVAAPGAAVVAALAAGLATVAGWEIRTPRGTERWSMPLMLVVHAAVAAGLAGGYALIDRPGPAVATLAASAALLGLCALRVRRRAGSATPVELVLLSTAVLVLDLGFAIAASGTLQLVGWAAGAVAFALLSRHAARARLPVLIGGLGLHAGLTLVETVGASGSGGGAFVVGCAVLAGVCATSARIVAPRSPDARAALDAAALGVVLWWTVATLPADRLALALAGEAVALLLLDRRARDAVARAAGLTFLAGAVGVALLHDDGAALRAAWDAVPDGALGDLVLPLVAAALAAGVGAWALRGLAAEPGDGGAGRGRPGPQGWEERRRERSVGQALDAPARPGALGAAELPPILVATTVGLALLAASVLTGVLVDALGGGPDAAAVARDVLWASAGLALLGAGLVRDEAPVRLAGLALLGAVGLKIGLWDLAGVDTAGRVVAWAVLGALLLAGAGLYARLRPAAARAEADVDAQPAPPRA